MSKGFEIFPLLVMELNVLGGKYATSVMPVSALRSPEYHLNKTNSVYTNEVGR